ncbi:Calcitonin receptor like protein [Argiope bruennichi]|uniref:Calcitonin receptor like protein n=1 Tax=Argiope bruennichi TaxID=94029 RepID=A0A8T0G1K5_ARGBR|nr:Calcitonin receptor like protein [Argiope bruennichi]
MEPFCKAIWDSFYCWPSTQAGRIVSRPCSVIFASFDVGFRGSHSKENAEAFRVCSEDGQWLWGNWTNYTQCLDLLPHDPGNAVGHLTVSYILFVCSFISLIALVLTLGIFCYFKSLQCSRLRVHRNLVVSLIIHSILLMIIPSTVIFRSTFPTYTDVVSSADIYHKSRSKTRDETHFEWLFLLPLICWNRVLLDFVKDAGASPSRSIRLNDCYFYILDGIDNVTLSNAAEWPAVANVVMLFKDVLCYGQHQLDVRGRTTPPQQEQSTYPFSA